MATIKTLLSATALSYALILSSASAYAAQPLTAPVSRLNHAKELLGKHYRHSVVRKGEHWADLSRQIRRWTRQAMKSSPKKVSDAVAKTILAESRRYELDPVFITAVIQSESSFNPRIVGSAGEIGMMQILPGTGEWIAKKNHLPWKGKKTLLDPVMNIRIGAAYFNFLRERFDNQSRLYLSAYNMGPKNVERALEKNVWPKEYAQRVMKHYVDFYTELSSEASARGRTLASRAH
jgi:soluble lytic murein transglycosylase